MYRHTLILTRSYTRKAALKKEYPKRAKKKKTLFVGTNFRPNTNVNGRHPLPRSH